MVAVCAEAISPVPQGRSSISLARLQTSYFADHFPSALGPLLKSWLGSFPLRLSCDKACSIFRIGRVSLSVFLPGKMSHRKAVALDGPPTFRRPMWPGFYRHHLIGLVGVVVGHFPSLSHDHLSPCRRDCRPGGRALDARVPLCSPSSIFVADPPEDALALCKTKTSPSSSRQSNHLSPFSL